MSTLDDITTQWLRDIDRANREDFYGNLGVFRAHAAAGDAYARQLMQLGYVMQTPTHVPPFHSVLIKLRESASSFAAIRLYENYAKDEHIAVHLDCNFGHAPHTTAWRETTLLTPLQFVRVLAARQFPVGGPGREGTNQTLAHHDLAHLASFAANAEYANAVQRVCDHLMRNCESAHEALRGFDSLLSLRLYYFVEVLVEISDVPLLEKLLDYSVTIFPLGTANVAATIANDLRRREPEDTLRYLAELYDNFHGMVNALGGESRDIYNRRRKHARSSDRYGPAASKFAGNSLYSLYYQAKDALEAVRPDHDAWTRTLNEVHAPFVAALVGSAQLCVADWEHALKTVTPHLDGAVCRYVRGLFAETHLFYRAFCDARFDATTT